MKNWLAASVLILAPLIAVAAEAPPEWAYPAAPANFQAPPDNGQPKKVPGSAKTYSEKDIGNALGRPTGSPTSTRRCPMSSRMARRRT